MDTPIDGFWIPQTVRASLLGSETEYATLSCVDGRTCQASDPGAVTVRYPLLSPAQWATLLAALGERRRQAPRGEAFFDRLQAALRIVGQRFADPSDPLRVQALAALPGYTGFSEPMIRFTLGALELMSLEQLPATFSLSPTDEVTAEWQTMPGLPGRLRFFAARPWQQTLRRLFGRGSASVFGPVAYPGLVVGYGAGNVPGTALLIALLSQATTLAGGVPPVVVVRSSRREPVFTPLVLAGLEAVDPDLLSTAAVLIWDAEDRDVQNRLLTQADLVIAAASDETIAQIGAQIGAQIEGQIAAAAQDRASGPVNRRSDPIRLHAHGHKVSFSAIGKRVLAHALVDQAGGLPVIDIVALLAALDSVFWDQYGCLSSRVHFVQEGGQGFYTALEYGAHLCAQMRLLATFLPRGAWPRRQIHDRFDRYKLLEAGGRFQVLSEYDDAFLVAVDQRPLASMSLAATVNDCQGRVVIVRPVAELMELPERYLSLLPKRNLQSLSVAVGQPGEGLTDHFLGFAEACGARGVTALRTVGRGAFPQLSYSWDGLIPLDLVRKRPAGHFTTIEFDVPFDEMIDTFHTLLRRGVALGLAGNQVLTG